MWDPVMVVMAALFLLAFGFCAVGLLRTFVDRTIYRRLYGTTQTPDEIERSALKRYRHLTRR